MILLNIFQSSYSLGCIYRGYEVKNDGVYYINGSERRKIEKADRNTFKVIKSPNYNLLAKDKNYVYYQGKRIEGINPDSYIITKEVTANEKKEGGYNCESTGYVIRDKGKEYILEEKQGWNRVENGIKKSVLEDEKSRIRVFFNFVYVIINKKISEEKLL